MSLTSSQDERGSERHPPSHFHGPYRCQLNISYLIARLPGNYSDSPLPLDDNTVVTPTALWLRVYGPLTPSTGIILV